MVYQCIQGITKPVAIVCEDKRVRHNIIGYRIDPSRPVPIVVIVVDELRLFILSTLFKDPGWKQGYQDGSFEVRIVCDVLERREWRQPFHGQLINVAVGMAGFSCGQVDVALHS